MAGSWSTWYATAESAPSSWPQAGGSKVTTPSSKASMPLPPLADANSTGNTCRWATPSRSAWRSLSRGTGLSSR